MLLDNDIKCTVGICKLIRAMYSDVRITPRLRLQRLLLPRLCRTM
jgi:hypothetical protein